MRSSSTRTSAWVALVLLAFALGATRAHAREFAGEVVQVGGSQLVVENRQGERVSFERSPKTVVEGPGGWGGLAPGTRVLVKWKLKEGPRVAVKVIVLGSGGKR